MLSSSLFEIEVFILSASDEEFNFGTKEELQGDLILNLSHETANTRITVRRKSYLHESIRRYMSLEQKISYKSNSNNE